MQRDAIGGRAQRAAAADDEADAERGAEGEGDGRTDARQAERGEHDAHQVEGGAVDLDPGHGLDGEGRKGQRRWPPEATVDLEEDPVNWRARVRLSESR